MEAVKYICSSKMSQHAHCMHVVHTMVSHHELKQCLKKFRNNFVVCWKLYCTRAFCKLVVCQSMQCWHDSQWNGGALADASLVNNCQQTHQ